MNDETRDRLVAGIQGTRVPDGLVSGNMAIVRRACLLEPILIHDFADTFAILKSLTGKKIAHVYVESMKCSDAASINFDPFGTVVRLKVITE